MLTRDPHFQTPNAAELRRVIAHLVRARPARRLSAAESPMGRRRVAARLPR